MMKRRTALAGSALWLWQGASASPEVPALLRAGGCVVVIRHALAPGTFDPPGFRLDDCSTQRNLNDTGREQARRLGAWFERRGLRPARVRSSPWCRCLDTARLAFGDAETWAALGSPVGRTEDTTAEARQALRQAVHELTRSKAPFEVWVTHMFVQQALTGEGTGVGDGLLVQAPAPSQVQVRARWTADG